jgi:hypothetical protein
MTEPDLEAIELRWEAADLATIDSRKTPDPDTGIMGVGTTNLTAIWDSASDVPNLLELVKAVKLGWQQEHDRAEELQGIIDAMKPVVAAVGKFVHGDNTDEDIQAIVDAYDTMPWFAMSEEWTR